MGNLREIQERHGWDRWKDALFISVAVLMTALAVGSLTTRAVTGKPPSHHWSLAVIETPDLAK